MPCLKPLLLSLVAGGLCFVALPIAAGADYYWNPASSSSNFWNDPGYWKPTTDGSGASPTSLSSLLIYSTNNNTLATSTGTSSFAGGTLRLDGGQISVKATGSSIATTAYLHSTGGLIVAAGASNVSHNFEALTFDAASGTTLLSASFDGTNNVGRSLRVTIGTLTGSAAIQTAPSTGDNRIIRLSVGDSAGYTGAFAFSRGTIEFESPVGSSGSLTLDGTVRVTLDHPLRFVAVTIDGTPLPEGGPYSVTELNAFGDHFNAGGLGSITVGPSIPPIPPAPTLLGVRPGLRLIRDSTVDTAGLVFSTGTYGTSMNGQTYQQEGVVSYQGYQYAAYWHSGKRPAVARRALPDGAWETIVFNDYGPITHTDVHNVNVIGICPEDGTVHLAFDHHNDPLHYRRSIAGVASNPAAVVWNQSLFGATTSTLVASDGALSGLSYPQFFTSPQGKLQFAHRNGSSGSGDWFLHEYSTAGWTRLGMLFSRGGTYEGKNARSAYPNQFRYDSTGRLHITWSWREYLTSLLGNHDLGYSYSDDFGRTWKNNAGANIALLNGATGATNAISINSPGHVAYPVKYNWGLMNTTTQFIDSQGRVHVISWRNPDDASASTLDLNQWRYFHYWRGTDGVWREQMLPFQGRKPQVVLDEVGNMHVVYGSGPDLNYHGDDPGVTLMAATATEASGWTDWVVQPVVSTRLFVGEPLLDMGRWEREKILSVYHQQQPLLDGSPPLRVTDFVPVAAQISVSERPFTTPGDDGGTVRLDERQNGGPMILNGITYTRGFGVHAPSEIVVPLTGLHTRFLSEIGMDDSVGNGGSVVFQVWADGTKLFDSGIMTGASATQFVDVDVYGKTELRLIVTDGGNGTFSDRANWADARLVCTPRFAWNQALFPGEADNPAISGDLSDPDADGVPNLLEYASGHDPLNPDSVPVIGPSIANRRLHLTLARIADPNLVYSVEASNNLVDADAWQPIWSSTGADNATGTFTVADLVTLDQQPRRFLRLKVTGY